MRACLTISMKAVSRSKSSTMPISPEIKGSFHPILPLP
jgi:hypothetical protein